MFADHERGPGEELRLQMEALLDFDEEDQKAARTVLEGLILRHNAKKNVMG